MTKADPGYQDDQGGGYQDDRDHEAATIGKTTTMAMKVARIGKAMARRGKAMASANPLAKKPT